MQDGEDYDDRDFDEPIPRKRSQRCQCDGEGYCPGPENCTGPGGYCWEEDNEESEE